MTPPPAAVTTAPTQLLILFRRRDVLSSLFPNQVIISKRGYIYEISSAI
jgi:hypothetical protein